VAIERIMPHTLRLRVTERDPLAQIPALRLQPDGRAVATALHLDEDGFVMTRLEPAQMAGAAAASRTNEFLPVLCGVSQNDIVPGKRSSSPAVRAALQLLAAFEHSPMAGLTELRQIDVSGLDVLQVTTAQQCKVTFGVRDLEGQLARWRVIYDEARSRGKTIATIDLSVSNNTPLRLLEVAAPPTAPPPANPQPTRRRNV
jgi:hypothetical protein